MRYYHKMIGGVAQLARASALHAEGHRFDSVRLHMKFFWKLGYLTMDVTRGLGFAIRTSARV